MRDYSKPCCVPRVPYKSGFTSDLVKFYKQTNPYNSCQNASLFQKSSQRFTPVCVLFLCGSSDKKTRYASVSFDRRHGSALGCPWDLTIPRNRFHARQKWFFCCIADKPNPSGVESSYNTRLRERWFCRLFRTVVKRPGDSL